MQRCSTSSQHPGWNKLKLAAAPGGFPHVSGCSFFLPIISRVFLLPAPCYPLAAPTSMSPRTSLYVVI